MTDTTDARPARSDARQQRAARATLAAALAAALAVAVAVPPQAPTARPGDVAVATQERSVLVDTRGRDLDAAGRATVDRLDGRWAVVRGTAADVERTVAARPGVTVTADPLMDVLATPDPLTWSQWHLSGPPGVSADRAPDRVDGTGVVVAVVDSGVETAHPDLAGQLWVNTDETCGNDVDDDGNGYVDDCHGWDFAQDDATIDDGDTTHGTHVATTLAAADNGIGVIGVAPGATVMPVKVMHDGPFPTSRLVGALDYAVANGADVINLSVGTAPGQPPIAALDAALRRAHAAGVVVVAAAGNDGVDIALDPVQPAASAAPGLVTVGAIARDGRAASFSNRGPAVDLHAPGVSIWAGVPGGRWLPQAGTSMAAPVVSGILALATQAAGRGTARSALLAGATRTDDLAGASATGARADAAGTLDHVGVALTDGWASPTPDLGGRLPDLGLDGGALDGGDLDIPSPGSTHDRGDPAGWTAVLEGDGRLQVGEPARTTLRLRGAAPGSVSVALVRWRPGRPELVDGLWVDGRDVGGQATGVRAGSRLTVVPPAGPAAVVVWAADDVQVANLTAAPSDGRGGRVSPAQGPTRGGTAVRLRDLPPEVVDDAAWAQVGDTVVPVYGLGAQLHLFTRAHDAARVAITVLAADGRPLVVLPDAFTFGDQQSDGRRVEADHPAALVSGAGWATARCTTLPCTTATP